MKKPTLVQVARMIPNRIQIRPLQPHTTVLHPRHPSRKPKQPQLTNPTPDPWVSQTKTPQKPVISLLAQQAPLQSRRKAETRRYMNTSVFDPFISCARHVNGYAPLRTCILALMWLNENGSAAPLLPYLPSLYLFSL